MCPCSSVEYYVCTTNKLLTKNVPSGNNNQKKFSAGQIGGCMRFSIGWHLLNFKEKPKGFLGTSSIMLLFIINCFVRCNHISWNLSCKRWNIQRSFEEATLDSDSSKFFFNLEEWLMETMESSFFQIETVLFNDINVFIFCYV